jgi:hypothetical protein
MFPFFKILFLKFAWNKKLLHYKIIALIKMNFIISLPMKNIKKIIFFLQIILKIILLETFMMNETHNAAFKRCGFELLNFIFNSPSYCLWHMKDIRELRYNILWAWSTNFLRHQDKCRLFEKKNHWERKSPWDVNKKNFWIPSQIHVSV